MKSTNLSITVTEEMDPYAQIVVYYFGELQNWNADSMYFNIYHGANMFKNKVFLFHLTLLLSEPFFVGSLQAVMKSCL